METVYRYPAIDSRAGDWELTQPLIIVMIQIESVPQAIARLATGSTNLGLLLPNE